MQSRTESLIESCLNVGSGFLVALVVWAYIVKPLFDIHVSPTENVLITLIFTVVSVVRGYAWRRWFNHRLHLKTKRTTGGGHASAGNNR